MDIDSYNSGQTQQAQNWAQFLKVGMRVFHGLFYLGNKQHIRTVIFQSMFQLNYVFDKKVFNDNQKK